MLPRALRRMSVSEIEALVPSFHEIAHGGLLVAATFYAAIAPLHLVVPPSGLGEPLFCIAVGTASFCSLYCAVLPRLGRFGLRGAMPSITLVVWLNSAVHLWLSHDAMQTTNLAIGLIIAGIVLLRRVEFL